MGLLSEARQRRAAYQKENPDSLLKHWDAALNAIPDALPYFSHGVNFSTFGQGADFATLPQTLAGVDPEQIPGTTEYLRAKAGVRAPEGLAEKAMYFAGQVAAPGPGELAVAGKAMLIGMRSKLFRKDILKHALKMENAGATPDEIWRETARMGQPQMRDPTDMNWKADIPFPGEMNDTMKDQLISHIRGERPVPLYLREATGTDLGYGKKFDEQYVFLRNGGGGEYIPAARQMKVGTVGTPTILAHETSHAVDEMENWPRGGTPDEFAAAALAKAKSLQARMFELMDKRQAGPLSAEERAELNATADQLWAVREKMNEHEYYQRYYKLGGEAKARNDAHRAGWTAEQIAETPWWETLDVPWDKQEIRYDGGRRAGKKGMLR